MLQRALQCGATAAMRCARTASFLSPSGHVASSRRVVSGLLVAGFATAANAAPNPALLSQSCSDGTSARYMETLFESWKKDPSSVPASWHPYFTSIDKGYQVLFVPIPGGGGAAPAASQAVADANATIKSSAILNLIRAYQVRGHVKADLDPLGLWKREIPAELKLETYGLGDDDLDKPIPIPRSPFLSGFLDNMDGATTLRVLVERLNNAYCAKVGVEYMHIQDRAMCNWIRDRIELKTKWSLNAEEKRRLYDRLLWAESFEKYLALKFGQGQKRFGVDGCEVLIPGIKALVDESCNLGVENIVMGMPHRGRLNVLANVVRKPLKYIFSEFKDMMPERSGGVWEGSGDVKYHLGTSCDRVLASGKRCHLALVANPSHLEAVNPVVEGKTRAKQDRIGDTDRSKVMTLLMHGDASFAGQGVIYEGIAFSGLRNYTTGGTIHVVVNNQVGFTTDPIDSRPGMYCTDIMKMGDIPIFHVNGDDPESVMYVFRIASQWRQAFKKDCVIDIYGYRRFGHNEGDEPSFTQPLMYQKIKAHPTTLELYEKRLLAEGVLTADEVQRMKTDVRTALDDAFKKIERTTHDKFHGSWATMVDPTKLSKARVTGYPREQLKKLGRALATYPAHFTPHPLITKLFEKRAHMIETGHGVDWGMAEALAFGSLLQEGVNVRLSGEDVQRGTFSHRYAVIKDHKTGEEFTPLCHLGVEKPGRFYACNSHLSEYAVLGFEYGYSIEDPNSLVLWEAQFGDFANGAQIIIDQFISCAEQKWARQSGLVLLLPHGYDGMGPEHSSARLERFLQLSDCHPRDVCLDVREKESESSKHPIQQANFQVCNITTPANYFHALRRQLKRDFRKPLIIMSPKSLLREPRCVSDLADFDDSHSHVMFHRVLPDPFPAEIAAPEQIERLVFCSGKVFYDLLKKRHESTIRNVALVRIEQLAPFPFDRVMESISLYNNAQIVWCQEEPFNMGAFQFVYHHLRSCAGSNGKGIYYAGRPASAATACGSHTRHDIEQAQLVHECLTAPLKSDSIY